MHRLIRCSHYFYQTPSFFTWNNLDSWYSPQHRGWAIFHLSCNSQFPWQSIHLVHQQLQLPRGQLMLVSEKRYSRYGVGVWGKGGLEMAKMLSWALGGQLHCKWKPSLHREFACPSDLLSGSNWPFYLSKNAAASPCVQSLNLDFDRSGLQLGSCHRDSISVRSLTAQATKYTWRHYVD